MSDNGFSPAAADSLGHSPKLGFSLHKALDRVLRKVGAREKSQTSHPPEGSTGTAPLSGHTSRRSSIGSMGLPETVSAGELPSSTRHAIMPGWQVRLSESVLLMPEAGKLCVCCVSGRHLVYAHSWHI